MQPDPPIYKIRLQVGENKMVFLAFTFFSDFLLYPVF